MTSFVFVYWVWILTSQSIYVAKTQSFGLYGLISHQGQTKSNYIQRIFIRNLFMFMLQLWISSPSRLLKGLKLNISLFWSLLATKAKFKQSIPWSLTLWLCPSVWFGYHKQFARSFAYCKVINMPQLTHKYLFNKILMIMII